MSAFVYGTLMYPQVLQALISRVPRMEPAVIHGYRRHCIRGQVRGEAGPSGCPGARRCTTGLDLDHTSPRPLPRCFPALCPLRQTRASAASCCTTCSPQRWRCGGCALRAGERCPTAALC